MTSTDAKTERALTGMNLTDIMLTLNGLKTNKKEKLDALSEFIEQLKQDVNNGKSQIEIHKETIIRMQQEKCDVEKEKNS